jgi:hypothetical protein
MTLTPHFHPKHAFFHVYVVQPLTIPTMYDLTPNLYISTIIEVKYVFPSIVIQELLLLAKWNTANKVNEDV